MDWIGLDWIGYRAGFWSLKMPDIFIIMSNKPGVIHEKTMLLSLPQRLSAFKESTKFIKFTKKTNIICRPL
jgi:hypothetical protein